jgi:hypothetical protein
MNDYKWTIVDTFYFLAVMLIFSTAVLLCVHYDAKIEAEFCTGIPNICE